VKENSTKLQINRLTCLHLAAGVTSRKDLVTLDWGRNMNNSISITETGEGLSA